MHLLGQENCVVSTYRLNCSWFIASDRTRNVKFRNNKNLLTND